MKQKVPSTSKAAYDRAKLGMIESHHEKILAALQVLGTVNYEAIANHLNMDRHAVGRRLSELEKDQKVFKPGTKSKTKSGCMAMNYSLTKPSATENEFKPGVMASSDYSKELIKTCQQSLF